MMEGWLKAYLNRLETMTADFLLTELSILCFVVKTIPAVLLAVFSSVPVQTTTDFQMQQESGFVVVMTATFLAPPLETIMGQWLPVLLLSFYTKKIYHLLLVPTLWFALWHVYAGWVSVFIVFFPGLVFTACFLSQYERSLWRALWTTTVIHALHNFFSLMFYFFMMYSTAPSISVSAY